VLASVVGGRPPPGSILRPPTWDGNAKGFAFLGYTLRSWLESASMMVQEPCRPRLGGVSAPPARQGLIPACSTARAHSPVADFRSRRSLRSAIDHEAAPSMRWLRVVVDEGKGPLVGGARSNHQHPVKA